MKKSKRLCWFFTNRQLVIILLLFLFGVIFQMGNVAANLQFLQVQKDVQNGNFAVWETYLLLLLILAVFTVLQTMYVSRYENTLKRYLRFNFFERYIYYFGPHEVGVFMRYRIIYGQLQLPTAVISSIFSLYTLVKTMKMVEFNSYNIAVGITLLFSAMLCGIVRGRIVSIQNKIENTIKEKKNDLTKYSSFSKAQLSCSLHVLDEEYKNSNDKEIGRVFFQNFPRLLKQLLYLFLVWGLVDTMANEVLYSETYLILTAYGTILSIADEIGGLIEKIISVLQMQKDADVKALDALEEKENMLLIVNQEQGWVELSEKGLKISPSFTLDVKSTNGSVRGYQLLKPLVIPKGEHCFVHGSKEVGKTRLLSFLGRLFPDAVMIYNDNCKIFNQWNDNFKIGQPIDYDLIRELAKGLKLQRFAQLSDDEMKDHQIANINTGDKHLSVALVMLYFAIKNPENAKIIILDELFANVDEANSKEILAFIMNKLESLGSTVIFVSHSKQDMIKEYCGLRIRLSKVSDAIIRISQVEH